VRLDDQAAAGGYWVRSRDAMAVAARVGADPNFLSTWASALLLLDEADAARPVLGQLASMGYKTRDLDALLVAKKQSYPHNAATLQCSGDEPELTKGFDMP